MNETEPLGNNLKTLCFKVVFTFAWTRGYIGSIITASSVHRRVAQMPRCLVSDTSGKGKLWKLSKSRKDTNISILEEKITVVTEWSGLMPGFQGSNPSKFVYKFLSFLA